MRKPKVKAKGVRAMKIYEYCTAKTNIFWTIHSFDEMRIGDRVRVEKVSEGAIVVGPMCFYCPLPAKRKGKR